MNFSATTILYGALMILIGIVLSDAEAARERQLQFASLPVHPLPVSAKRMCSVYSNDRYNEQFEQNRLEIEILQQNYYRMQSQFSNRKNQLQEVVKTFEQIFVELSLEVDGLQANTCESGKLLNATVRGLKEHKEQVEKILVTVVEKIEGFNKQVTILQDSANRRGVCYYR